MGYPSIPHPGFPARCHKARPSTRTLPLRAGGFRGQRQLGCRRAAALTRSGRDCAGFRDWVEALLNAADPGEDLPDDLVPATSLWIVEDDEYLGAIQLRHRLNPFLSEIGGHIGFGVRPGARRRGLAGLALADVLPRARRLGLSRVLVTCDDTNTGSARTIEGRGGVLERVRPPDDVARDRGFHAPIRRYWITP